MNNKKKLIVIFIIIIMLLIATLVLLKFIVENKKIVINNLSVNYEKSSNPCLNNDNCQLDDIDYYPNINIDTNSKTLTRLVDRYNEEVNNAYDKVINSNLNSSECSNVKDTFKYRYTNSIVFDVYYDDKIVSITKNLNIKDLCLDKIIQDDYETNVYSINTSKLLSNEDILKLYNFTEEDIINKINEGVNIENSISMNELTIEEMFKDGKLNYNIYFNEEGYMLIKYTSSKTNKTYSIILTKIDE